MSLALSVSLVVLVTLVVVAIVGVAIDRTVPNGDPEDRSATVSR